MGILTKEVFDSLFAWRDAKRFSQQDAADLFGITQPHYCNLENGKTGAKPKLAKKISQLTGVPMERLLNFGDDESGVGAVRRAQETDEKPKDLP